MKLAPEWISLLGVAIALHGYHKGFCGGLTWRYIALAVAGLILAYCIHRASASERLVF